jgi:hypothetical protein
MAASVRYLVADEPWTLASRGLQAALGRAEAALAMAAATERVRRALGYAAAQDTPIGRLPLPSYEGFRARRG